jgi:hypothetical protein
MAIKAIIFGNSHMTPCGSGWKVDGLFYGTWSAAHTALHDGEIPTAEQVQEQEDADISRRLDVIEDTNHCIAERRMRSI